jgi:hypothetical protein
LFCAHSHTYVNVYFNGELVGHTAEAKHGPVIDWGAAAAAANQHHPERAGSADMILVVPRGQPLGSCRLELEVVAVEHHTHIGLHMTTTSVSTVLGARLIAGSELEALAGIPSKSLPDAVAPPPKAIGAGGTQFFSLEASKRPGPVTATKTGPVPTGSSAPVADPEPVPTSGLLKAMSFRTKPDKPKRGPALDAAALASSSNAQAAALAADHAALPISLTPQGEVGIILRPAVSASGLPGGFSSSVASSSGAKNIVIEEPELIRENSTLHVNILGLKDVVQAVMAVMGPQTDSSTSVIRSESAATSFHPSVAPAYALSAAAAAATQVVDMVVRWNGVSVGSFLASVNVQTGAVELPQKAVVDLCLPFNLTIRDCYLEILLWCGKMVIGSVVYWGTNLAKMSGVRGEARDGAHVEGEDAHAPMPTAEQNRVVTTGDLHWRALERSQSIPPDLQVSSPTGRILLQATLIQPILQKKSTAMHRDPNRKRTFFRTIGSDLTAEKKHWEYRFTDANGGRHDRAEGEGADQVVESTKFNFGERRGSNLNATPDAPYRKRLLSDTSRQNSLPEDDSRSNMAPSGAPGAAADGTPGAPGGAEGIGAATLGLLGDRAKHQKLRLELSAVGFTVTVHQEIDEHRICWRGRVMPKNFIGNEGTRKAMMVSRASRLVRTHGINDIQVMSEIHQLVDTGDEQEEVNDLPICVKEILTDGPGLILRTYRVEISANNGVMMGFADIKDEVVDLERVIGHADVPRLLPPERKHWKLGAIFQHVVRERVILDMLMGKAKPTGKDGRREGLVQMHEENMELTGSIISVTRDPTSEEVAKAARAKREAEEAAVAAAKAAEEAALAASKSLGLGLGLGLNINLGLKGFKFGFGKGKPAAEVPSVVTDEESVQEVANTNETMRGSTRGAYSTASFSASGGDDDEDYRESFKTGRSWLRIHARTHRVVGKPLRSVVLLLTTPQTDPLFATDVDRYFKTVHGRPCLLQFDILFRCKDSFTKETRELLLTPQEVDEWFPQSREIDMTTRFRRDKVGAYFLQYLSVKFTESGAVGLYLVKENVDVSSSIDDLIAEDEQQQQQQQEAKERGD